jgi:hypothetical protein
VSQSQAARIAPCVRLLHQFEVTDDVLIEPAPRRAAHSVPVAAEVEAN